MVLSSISPRHDMLCPALCCTLQGHVLEINLRFKNVESILNVDETLSMSLNHVRDTL